VHLFRSPYIYIILLTNSIKHSTPLFFLRQKRIPLSSNSATPSLEKMSPFGSSATPLFKSVNIGADSAFLGADQPEWATYNCKDSTMNGVSAWPEPM